MKNETHYIFWIAKKDNIKMKNLQPTRAARRYKDTRTGPNCVLRPVKVIRTCPNQGLKPIKTLFYYEQYFSCLKWEIVCANSACPNHVLKASGSPDQSWGNSRMKKPKIEFQFDKFFFEVLFFSFHFDFNQQEKETTWDFTKK